MTLCAKGRQKFGGERAAAPNAARCALFSWRKRSNSPPDRDLLHQPAAFRAEVIVHELLHIKYPYPHHGKTFRSLVRSYLARYGLVAWIPAFHCPEPALVVYL